LHKQPSERAWERALLLTRWRSGIEKKSFHEFYESGIESDRFAPRSIKWGRNKPAFFFD
jgi:hypothetical protein